MSRAERRRSKRNRRSDRGTPTSLDCRFPNLFGTDGCCMCGHPDLQQCPCKAIEALRHQESAHQDWEAAA